MIPKLKYEHINLSSFAKMRVDLAAQVCSSVLCATEHANYVHVQVLSESVSKALMLTGSPEVQGTATFVLMFDKFFDMMNVGNFTNGTRYRKPFKHPYRSSDDVRFSVSTCIPDCTMYSIHAYCSGLRMSS